MAALITVEEAQQWLSDSKLEVNDLNSNLEAASARFALAALAPLYDVSTWTNANATPKLVRDIISMYYAGSLWNSQMQEAAGEPPGYGDKLIERAMYLLEAIKAGEMDVFGAAGELIDPTGGEGPSFLPDDASTDLYHNDPTHLAGTPRNFHMNQVF